MQNTYSQKALILILIMIPLGMSSIPIINAEWWPMFGGDITHSRYTPSLAPDTNSMRWSYTTNGAVESSPAVVHGRVYVGSADGKVYCLDAVTGSLVWSYTTASYVDSSPGVVDGRVYVGSYDGKVYCLDAVTGDWVWDFSTGDYVHSSPGVVDGRVYVGSADGKVYCLDAVTGSLVWSYTTASYVDSSPGVVDGRVYVGSYDGKVYCLDAVTGDWVWDFSTGDYVHSSPGVVDGRVYVGSADGKVYCLDAVTGDWVWDFSTGDYVHSSPAIANGKVYVGSNDYKIYCLDAMTGGWVWDYSTNSYIDSSPAVANGYVYIGSDDKTIYCLNAITGDFIWSYAIGDYVKSSPAIADANIYIGSDNRKIYCFGTRPDADGGGSEPSSNQNPVADPSAGEPYQGLINTTIIFNGSRSYDPDGIIANWFWDFGDLSNGTGKITNHTYTQAGNYIVTLKVMDNKGATNTRITTCLIKSQNSPPTPPLITGPTTGTKNRPYTYKVVSSDPDDDMIVYVFDWGGLFAESSGFVKNGTIWTVNHSWASAGRYHLAVTVTDTLAQSSSDITIYIDSVQTGDIGYLLDYNADGTYDEFYSDQHHQTTPVQRQQDTYRIDSNGDGKWDYCFNELVGLTEYKQPDIPGFELFVVISATVIILLWKPKKINRN
jgi:outer membrane protein assembly factor BamB